MIKNSLKKPNEIGEHYINSTPDVQRLFCSYLNTYAKSYGIGTNLAKQFRETEMFKPLHNVRLSVIHAARDIFHISLDCKMAAKEPVHANIPLKPQQP